MYFGTDDCSHFFFFFSSFTCLSFLCVVVLPDVSASVVPSSWSCHTVTVFPSCTYSLSPSLWNVCFVVLFLFLGFFLDISFVFSSCQVCVRLVQLVRSLTANQEVLGSSPGLVEGWTLGDLLSPHRPWTGTLSCWSSLSTFYQGT